MCGGTGKEMVCDGFGESYCFVVFGEDIVSTQRCWWGCKLYGSDIWRRNVMRRYVLGNAQSEDVFIYCISLIRDKYYNVSKKI